MKNLNYLFDFFQAEFDLLEHITLSLTKILIQSFVLVVKLAISLNITKKTKRQLKHF